MLTLLNVLLELTVNPPEGILAGINNSESIDNIYSLYIDVTITRT